MVFGQGPLGMMDVFIHPSYISTAGPWGMHPYAFVIVLFVVLGLIIAFTAWCVYYLYFGANKRRKAHQEQLMNFKTINRDG